MAVNKQAYLTSVIAEPHTELDRHRMGGPRQTPSHSQSKENMTAAALDTRSIKTSLNLLRWTVSPVRVLHNKPLISNH